MTEAVIETSQETNQWTGFYMITASVMKELKLKIDVTECALVVSKFCL